MTGIGGQHQEKTIGKQIGNVGETRKVEQVVSNVLVSGELFKPF